MATTGYPIRINERAVRQPDLSADERDGLRAFVVWLEQRYGNDVLRVVLFGSKARGDDDAESDLDVLVVARGGDYWQRWREITDFTSRLLLQTGVNISALVCAELRYRWWMLHHAPIYRSIQKDGIELWTRHNERSSPSA